MSERIVRLLRAHPHGGKRYAAGTRLRVSKALGDWWVAQGIARDAGAATTVAKPQPTISKRCCGRR